MIIYDKFKGELINNCKECSCYKLAYPSMKECCVHYSMSNKWVSFEAVKNEFYCPYAYVTLEELITRIEHDPYINYRIKEYCNFLEDELNKGGELECEKDEGG